MQAWNFMIQPSHCTWRQMHLELNSALLQTRSGTSCPREKAADNSILWPTAFASKSLSSAERRYNIEREVLGILHGLEKFCHCCFVREVSIITDHKAQLAILKKDVATLSQRIQWILNRIHQYRVRIIHKLGPDLFIADWLPRQNHKENKDKEIPGMQLMLMPYRQLQTLQIAWYNNYNRQPDKIITYNSSKIILSDAGQRTQIKYHKTWEHTGHFKMIWQWLMGSYSKADV